MEINNNINMKANQMNNIMGMQMSMIPIKMNQINNYFLLEIIIFHLIGKTSLIAKYCEERISRGQKPHK